MISSDTSQCHALQNSCLADVERGPAGAPGLQGPATWPCLLGRPTLLGKDLGMRPRARGRALEPAGGLAQGLKCGLRRKQPWGCDPPLTGSRPGKGTKGSPRNPGTSCQGRTEVFSSHRGAKASLQSLALDCWTSESLHAGLCPGRVCAAAVGALTVPADPPPFHMASDGLSW